MADASMRNLMQKPVEEFFRLETITKIRSKDMKRIMRGIAVVAMMAVAVIAVSAADSLYGNMAAKNDSSLTIEDMLLYAAQDEYLAKAEYVAIMAKFGIDRPFSNIMRSEETHLELLRAAYKTYSLSFPPDEAKNYLHVPATLKEAFEIGVKAEIDNIAMYDKFLSTDLIKDPQNLYLKNLFTNLRNASQNHLRTFQNQLSKY
jgi:hypothetical protein